MIVQRRCKCRGECLADVDTTAFTFRRNCLASAPDENDTASIITFMRVILSLLFMSPFAGINAEVVVAGGISVARGKCMIVLSRGGRGRRGEHVDLERFGWSEVMVIGGMMVRGLNGCCEVVRHGQTPSVSLILPRVIPFSRQIFQLPWKEDVRHVETLSKSKKRI